MSEHPSHDVEIAEASHTSSGLLASEKLNGGFIDSWLNLWLGLGSTGFESPRSLYLFNMHI